MRVFLFLSTLFATVNPIQILDFHVTYVAGHVAPPISLVNTRDLHKDSKEVFLHIL